MTIDFSRRSREEELMDRPGLDPKVLNLALSDISRVNRWLGGNRITIKAIETVIARHPDRTRFTLVDVGCGDGEMLRTIQEHFKDHPVELELVGIDLNSASLDLARKQSPGIIFLHKDITQRDSEADPYDFVLCTLTLHHLQPEDVSTFLRALCKMTRLQLIINDLERSRWAFQLFRLFSAIFIRSPLARHDGRLSILRSFTKSELQSLSENLGITNDTIARKWAFRLLWNIPKQQSL
ncbi:methyltransferase domain-containing protein [Croceiramulus getboli]|nr:methyltransferase domain-containing protein [Flavobacteriaceae bacterium YJPT1-3]